MGTPGGGNHVAGGQVSWGQVSWGPPQFAGVFTASSDWNPGMGLPKGLPWGLSGKAVMHFHGKGPMSQMPSPPPTHPGLVKPTPGFLAFIGLEPSYTVEELKAHLLEYDFEPEEVVSFAYEGSFGLFFKEFTEAAALHVALEGLKPVDTVLTKCIREFYMFLWKPFVWRPGDETQEFPPGVRRALVMKWPELEQFLRHSTSLGM